MPTVSPFHPVVREYDWSFLCWRLMAVPALPLPVTDPPGSRSCLWCHLIDGPGQGRSPPCPAWPAGSRRARAWAACRSLGPAQRKKLEYWSSM